jgi:hypothetical protein
MLLLTARAAYAQPPVELSASLSAGATDNALAAPKGSDEVVSDGFGVVDLSGALRFGGFRAPMEVSYRFGATFYADTTAANARSHELSWTGLFGLTPATELRSTLGTAYTRRNSVNPLDAARAQVTLTPAGPVTYFTANATEELTARLSPSYQLVSGLEAVYFRPVSSPEPLPAPLTLSARQRAERMLAVQTVFAELAAGLTIRPELRDDAGQTIYLRERTLSTELLVGWLRHFTPAWSASVAAGLQGIGRLEGGRVVLGPAALANLDYHRERGLAGLTYDHRPQPNVYFGESTVSDRLALRAFLPLHRREQLWLGAFAAYEHARLVDQNFALTTAYDIRAAGANLTYRFPRAPLALRAEYVINDQDGREVDGRTIPSLRRQVAMLSVTGVWGEQRTEDKKSDTE